MSSTDTSTDTEIGLTEAFDYATSAELFSLTGRRGRHQPLNYKRFASAAEAIRFAIEDLPPQCLLGTYLEVDEFEIRERGNPAAYTQARSYPLPRRAADPIG